MSIRQFFRVLFGRSKPPVEDPESGKQLRAAMESLSGHIADRRKAISYANRKMAEADQLLDTAADALRSR